MTMSSHLECQHHKERRDDSVAPPASVSIGTHGHVECVLLLAQATRGQRLHARQGGGSRLRAGRWGVGRVLEHPLHAGNLILAVAAAAALRNMVRV